MCLDLHGSVLTRPAETTMIGLDAPRGDGARRAVGRFGEDARAIGALLAVSAVHGGVVMTFEQCQSVLVSIRRQQGTASPLLRVDYAGAVYRGRLRRSDSDADNRRGTASPFGVLVLEGLGLQRQPETILQIASIPENGLHSLDDG